MTCTPSTAMLAPVAACTCAGGRARKLGYCSNTCTAITRQPQSGATLMAPTSWPAMERRATRTPRPWPACTAGSLELAGASLLDLAGLLAVPMCGWSPVTFRLCFLEMRWSLTCPFPSHIPQMEQKYPSVRPPSCPDVPLATSDISAVLLAFEVVIDMRRRATTMLLNANCYIRT